MSENLKLWATVEKTDPDQVKPITGKPYRGTSPKPYYLVQKATETFGPCGIGWGFCIVSERVEDGSAGDKVHIAHIRLWYVWNGQRGEVEHVGQTMLAGKNKNGPYTDEDAPKKSVTDALVKALSMIGFAGDIFMGRYDDSKYVQELREEARQESQSEPMTGRTAAGAGSRNFPASAAPLSILDRMVAAIGVLKTASEIFEWWNLPKVQEGYASLTPKGQMAVEKAKRKRLAEIESPFQEAAA